MIVPLHYKVGALMLVITVALGLTYFKGYNSAAEKYIAEKEIIVAQLNVLESKAKEDKQRWEKENDEATKKHNTDVAVLRNRIKRLLLPMPTQIPTTTPTNSTEAPNGTTSEWPTSGLSAEGCLLDALQVMEWQQWATQKGIKAE